MRFLIFQSLPRDMLHILSLSLELLRNVASYLDITDFAAFALSCPELHLQLLSNERYNKDIIQVSSRRVRYLPRSFPTIGHCLCQKFLCFIYAH